MKIHARARRWRSAAGAAALLLLAACTYTPSADDGIDYKSAGVREPLDVPPDLVNPARAPRGELTSGATDTSLSEYRRTREARSGQVGQGAVLPQVDGVRLERDGRQRWLQVSLPPDQVWPIVREFWLDNGFLIAEESPAVGVLETDWAENRAKIPSDLLRNTLGRFLDTLYSTGERDRFRTRLDRVAGGTEITITHRGMEEVYVDQRQEQTRWQPRDSDPSLEIEFLRRLMLRFGADEETSRLAADAVRDAPARPVAQLVGAGADSRLMVDERFERAWRRIGIALDRGGFAVEDRNRAEGLYFVRYIDPELANQRPGFIARVFGGASDLEPNQRFRIHVADAGEQAEVSVRLPDGEAVPEAQAGTAERMLRVLEEQLTN